MTYTITEIAEKFSLTKYTLRYYEKEGLIPPVKKNKNGVREYDDGDLFWIEFVRCLKDTGMKLCDVKEIIRLSVNDDEANIPVKKEILENHRRNVQEKIIEYNKNLKKIENKINYYDGRLEEIRKRDALKTKINNFSK